MEDKNDYAACWEILKKNNPGLANDPQKLAAKLEELDKAGDELKGKPREVIIARCILIQGRNVIAYGLGLELKSLPDIEPES